MGAKEVVAALCRPHKIEIVSGADTLGVLCVVQVPVWLMVLLVIVLTLVIVSSVINVIRGVVDLDTKFAEEVDV